MHVNPHYFGNIHINDKNNKTRFFITSTFKRNYTYLISAFEKLKFENYSFEIIVTGHINEFSDKIIPDIIKDSIKFKIGVSYSELFNEVENSDYIIINLDPESPYDNMYKTVQVTGSAQLSYGFLKPAIINKNFSSFYYFNSQNSFPYDNANIYEVLKDAILLNKEKYKEMQNNLKIISDYIYHLSLKNINNIINSI